MMKVREAYNIWAEQYDTNENKTRDLEAIALRDTLADMHVAHCLEIGCGTGKNTAWLMNIAEQITAIDFSEEMLAIAQKKIISKAVRFIQADITAHWYFVDALFDLAVFSLVLEHIEDLNDVFRKLSSCMKTNGHVYIGELHPFKQYNGTKARFETAEGQQLLTCFNHHISDFTDAAKHTGFEIIHLKEYFDDDDKKTLPRILTLLLKKTQHLE